MSVEPAEPPAHVSFQVFLDGIVAAIRSVFFYVLVGTYIGLGALAHEVGFQLLVDGIVHDADLGGAGAGHPGVDAEHGRALARWRSP